MKPIPPLRRARGEMLPLMDMIFLLLVVFIFQIVQMRPDFGISVELPVVARTPSDAQAQEDKITITISVNRSDEIFVNEAPVAAVTGLIPAIEQKADGRTQENINLILRADQHANYGRIVEIFSLLRQHDLRKVVFDVDASDPNDDDENTQP